MIPIPSPGGEGQGEGGLKLTNHYPSLLRYGFNFSLSVSRPRWISDFVADFRQETEVKTLNRTLKASGKVSFKRPGKMLWRYEEPKGQFVLADGKPTTTSASIVQQQRINGHTSYLATFTAPDVLSNDVQITVSVAAGYATNVATRTLVTEDEVRRFQRPFDSTPDMSRKQVFGRSFWGAKCAEERTPAGWPGR